MLKPSKSYEDAYKFFRWEIPEFCNIGVEICDKWADQRYRLALIYENQKGQVEQYTFWDLKRLSNGLANGLQAHGIGRGNRVGILLPQCPETAIFHIAIYKTAVIVRCRAHKARKEKLVVFTLSDFIILQGKDRLLCLRLRQIWKR